MLPAVCDGSLARLAWKPALGRITGRGKSASTVRLLHGRLGAHELFEACMRSKQKALILQVQIVCSQQPFSRRSFLFERGSERVDSCVGRYLGLAKEFNKSSLCAIGRVASFSLALQLMS